MNDANYCERRVESDSTQVERLTTALDAARKEAEYWHRRFFMTDCYDGCDPLDNGWRPLKWDADGKAVYTEPPVEDEDDIVAAAERQYERENDTPTEPRSDLD